VILKDANTPTE